MAKGRRQERQARWLQQQRALAYVSPTVGLPEGYRIPLPRGIYQHVSSVAGLQTIRNEFPSLHGHGQLTAAAATKFTAALKTCTRCHQEKPLNAFGDRAASADGCNYYCRDCVAAIRRRSSPGRTRWRRPVHVDAGLGGAGELANIEKPWALVTWPIKGRLFAHFDFYATRAEAETHAVSSEPYTIVDITRRPHDARVRELSDEQILKARGLRARQPV